MNTGKIVQVSGPVVDVEFDENEIPAIRTALYVMLGEKKLVMEVAQHIGKLVDQSPVVEILETGNKGNRSSCALCKGRKDRSFRRSRCR